MEGLRIEVSLDPSSDDSWANVMPYLDDARISVGGITVSRPYSFGGPATTLINWPGIGSVGAETTRAFAHALLAAADEADAMDARRTLRRRETRAV